MDQNQYARCGTDRASGAIGWGVAESHNQNSVYTESLVWGNAMCSTSATYQHTELLLWGGVIYLSTQSLLSDSSLLNSDF